MPTERRKFIRFPFHSRAEIQFRGLSATGTLRDISLNGALFAFDATPSDSPLLRPCRLHILYNGANEPTSSFNGLVVHSRYETLGIKFIGVGDRERVALIQLIELNLGEPALLDRDVPGLLRQMAPLGEVADDD